MSTGMLLILLPASIASSTPFSVRGTSTQPVNRFFSFHIDSPCLIRINAASPEEIPILETKVERETSSPKAGAFANS